MPGCPYSMDGCHLSSLFAALCTLYDKRDAGGLCYALVTVLVFIVPAKLAGEDHLRGIAQWVKLRKGRRQAR